MEDSKHDEGAVHYARPECIFNYCPDAEDCHARDACRHTVGIPCPADVRNAAPRETLNVCGSTWREREGGFRHCDYCGSLRTEDAIRALKQPGTRFSGSDWKYGFPHKFYIEPPNPEPEKQYKTSWSSGPDINQDTPGAVFEEGRWVKIGYSTKIRLFCKFYTRHLKDVGPEVFQEFAEAAERIFGIKFVRDEQGVKYMAPRTDSFYGYQRAGMITEEGVKHDL